MKVKDILIRQKYNEQIAIIYQNKEISYMDLYQESCKHRENISSIQSNRNIGIFFHNSINYAIAYFAIALSDKVIIPVEDNIKIDSFAGMVMYCEISLLITDEENYYVLYDMAVQLNNKIVIYNISTGQFIQLGNGDFIKQGNDDEEDVIIMLHTSGTTRNPKRVMLTNANIIANIESNIQSLEISSKDVCLIVLPMFFGYCNTSQFLSHLYVGAKLIIYNSIFSPRRFLDLIDKEKCTNTTCVPSMLFLVVNNAKRANYDLSSLRYMCFGGGIMPIDTLKKIINFFDKTGIIQTYGQTEASPRVTCLLPKDTKKKIGSVGKAIPNVVVDIFDEYDKPINNGEIGRAHV